MLVLLIVCLSEFVFVTSEREHVKAHCPGYMFRSWLGAYTRRLRFPVEPCIRLHCMSARFGHAEIDFLAISHLTQSLRIFELLPAYVSTAATVKSDSNRRNMFLLLLNLVWHGSFPT